MSISNQMHIYIISPSYFKTGGTKSLHQLADILAASGFDVSMIYCEKGDLVKKDSMLYEFCRAKMTDPEEILDDVNSIILVPEIFTGILKRFKKSKKIVWWLSLDFFLSDPLSSAKRTMHKKNLPQILLPIMILYKRAIGGYSFDQISTPEEFSEIYHLYNCEYVRSFLIQHGAVEEKMRYLCGPLENDYLHLLEEAEEIIHHKEDMIAYNPAKMNLTYLKKLKKDVLRRNGDIKFVAIENMTKEDVQNTLRKSKVYLDFGYFPGPERMPREAAMLQCNIITSKLGSAANSVDVPIPAEYKFDLNKAGLNRISDKILELINNYETYICDFDIYRRKITEQITSFENDIFEVFEEML